MGLLVFFHLIVKGVFTKNESFVLIFPKNIILFWFRGRLPAETNFCAKKKENSHARIPQTFAQATK